MGDGSNGAVRIAATGDLHFGDGDSADRIGTELGRAVEEADVLLIAGDLTSHGKPEQARAVASVLEQINLPKVAVLGNHDYECDAPDEVRQALGLVGVRVLEAESCVLQVNGIQLGVVGVKGFGGGFRGASASDFG